MDENQDEKELESSPTEEAEEPQTDEAGDKTIPYDRFKEVNDSKNEAEKKAAELQARLDELEEEKKEVPAGSLKEKSIEKEQDNVLHRMDEIEAKAELRFEGYTREEISYIDRYAKANGMSLDEAKADKFVQGGINTLRDEQKTEDNTPSPSRRSFTHKGKTWGTMTKEERKANFGAMQQSLDKRRVNVIE